MKNSFTISPFFLAGMNLLLFCASSARDLNNTNDDVAIQDNDVSDSRSARQYVMPGFLMNYQQTPLNTFDWFHDPPNPMQSLVDTPDVEYDYRSLLNRVKFPIGCGRGPAALPQRQIVGGSEAVKNSWPFIVALRYNGNVQCVGSLISPNKILTAAHCVDQLSLFEISQMTVSLGMHIINKNDAQVTRRVSRVSMHNGYNSDTYVNDIAVLTLDAPVPFFQCHFARLFGAAQYKC